MGKGPHDEEGRLLTKSRPTSPTTQHWADSAQPCHGICGWILSGRLSSYSFIPGSSEKLPPQGRPKKGLHCTLSPGSSPLSLTLLQGRLYPHSTEPRVYSCPGAHASIQVTQLRKSPCSTPDHRKETAFSVPSIAMPLLFRGRTF